MRIDNEPMRFADEVAKAPAGSEVVIEATYGWYWAVDLLQEPPRTTSAVTDSFHASSHAESRVNAHSPRREQVEAGRQRLAVERRREQREELLVLALELLQGSAQDPLPVTDNPQC